MAASLAAAVILAACSGGQDEPERPGDASGGVETRPGDASGGESAQPEDVTDAAGGPLLALYLAPMEATHVSVVDFEALKTRLGVPDLTSEDLMTDRLEFWREAPTSAVLLTEGAFREENSLFDLQYGFTQDDVRWEGRWAGDELDSDEPEVGGWALQVRPGVEPALVHAAIEDGRSQALTGAIFDETFRVISAGAIGSAGSTWADDPYLLALAGVGVDSQLLRRGCVPVTQAIGIDATFEDLDAITADHDIPGLLDVHGFAVAFVGAAATVRVVYPDGVTPEAAHEDVAARIAIAQDWPAADSISAREAFDIDHPSEAVAVSATPGIVVSINLNVTDPNAAAAVVLSDLFPIGICANLDDATELAEPTGLG